MQKNIRLCYWDSEKRFSSAEKINIEASIAHLGSIQTSTIQNLEELNQKTCDLLIISALQISPHQLQHWLQKLETKIIQNHSIKIPSLIFAKPDASIYRTLMEFTHQSNWYFDILSTDQLESLPIRAANLLRIHDHLHELQRYESTLNDLTSKVKTLESKLGLGIE